MIRNNEISLVIPAEADYIDIARLTLYGLSNKMGFSYEDIEDMKVAIAEACNNVVLHAYREEQAGDIEIQYQLDSNKLVITVGDHGSSFNYKQVLHDNTPHHEKRLEEIHAGGLGIYLMQALMDEVEVRSGEGTKVILTKYLNRERDI